MGRKKGAAEGPAQKRVGVAGLGSMGAAIAQRLMDSGFDVWVTNRTPARAEPLLAAGAHWAASPGELASRVPVVITMVSDDTALEEVMTGEHGVLTGAPPQLVCADMSTVSPDASTRVARACAEAGVGYLRAPVSGGPSLAAAGQLGTLVSGPPDLRSRLQGLLDALSSSVFYLGEDEEARVMKLALNMLIGTTAVGLGEALVMGERWGLDRQSMLDVFTGSAIASPFLKYKAPLLARRDFPPAFSTKLLAKDLDLAVHLARRAGSEVGVTDRAREVVEEAIAAGLGDADAVSVVVFLEQIARTPGAVERLAIKVEGTTAG